MRSSGKEPVKVDHASAAALPELALLVPAYALGTAERAYYFVPTTFAVSGRLRAIASELKSIFAPGARGPLLACPKILALDQPFSDGPDGGLGAVGDA